MKRVTAKDYLSQEVDYGGEQQPLGRVIADLQDQGATDQEVGVYLVGLFMKKGRKHAAKTRHDGRAG